MKAIKNIELKSSLLAILGILLSKMCCILPLIGAALGGSVFLDGIKIIAPFMLLASVAIISYSWYQYLYPKQCNCCQQKKQKRNTLLLSSALLIVLFLFQIVVPLFQPSYTNTTTSIANMPMCHSEN